MSNDLKIIGIDWANALPGDTTVAVLVGAVKEYTAKNDGRVPKNIYAVVEGYFRLYAVTLVDCDTLVLRLLTSAELTDPSWKARWKAETVDCVHYARAQQNQEILKGWAAGKSFAPALGKKPEPGSAQDSRSADQEAFAQWRERVQDQFIRDMRVSAGLLKSPSSSIDAVKAAAAMLDRTGFRGMERATAGPRSSDAAIIDQFRIEYAKLPLLNGTFGTSGRKPEPPPPAKPADPEPPVRQVNAASELVRAALSECVRDGTWRVEESRLLEGGLADSAFTVRPMRWLLRNGECHEGFVHCAFSKDGNVLGLFLGEGAHYEYVLLLGFSDAGSFLEVLGQITRLQRGLDRYTTLESTALGLIRMELIHQIGLCSFSDDDVLFD